MQGGGEGGKGKKEGGVGDRIPGDPTGRAGFITSTRDAYVIGMRWNLDNQGFTQDLESVQASSVFKHDNNYFIIGTHALGSTRKLFY